MALHYTPACQKPLNHGGRICGNRNSSKHTQILGDSNTRPTRCLARTEISILTCMETTRPRELHPRVKIQDYTPTMRHEIQIRQTRKCLDDTRFLLSHPRTSPTRPFSFERTHNSKSKITRLGRISRLPFKTPSTNHLTHNTL